jgi:hypothetical protein
MPSSLSGLAVRYDPARQRVGFRFRVPQGAAIVAADEFLAEHETGSSIFDRVVDGGGGHRGGRVVLRTKR